MYPGQKSFERLSRIPRTPSFARKFPRSAFSGKSSLGSDQNLTIACSQSAKGVVKRADGPEAK